MRDILYGPEGLAMDGFWEKISSYNIFNNLFPGALYVYFLERTTHISLSGSDIVKSVILYYFVGLVIGRVGSLLLEPILKVIKVVRFVPYEEYISACALNSKIELLQEVANMYRTLLSMSLLLLGSFFLMEYISGADYSLSKYTSVFLIFLFLISYVKQVAYVIKRVNKVNGN